MNSSDPSLATPRVDLILILTLTRVETSTRETYLQVGTMFSLKREERLLPLPAMVVMDYHQLKMSNLRNKLHR